MQDGGEREYTMRTFLSIKREENTKDKYYIAGVINSDMYPSTYASETPDARIVELPELEGKGFAGCHIKL